MGKNPPDPRCPNAHREVGINADRGCTDCWCLIIMLLAYVAIGFVAYLGFNNGNPDRLLEGTDLLNQMCGKGGVGPNVSYDGNRSTTVPDWSERRYIWFPISYNFDKRELILIDALRLGFCVTDCPQKSDSLLDPTVVKSYGPPDSEAPAYPVLYNSQPRFGRCIPDFLSFDCQGVQNCTDEATNSSETFSSKARATSAMVQGLLEVKEKWWIILVCTLAAVILSFFWLALLRCIIKPIVVITLVLVLLTLIGVGIVFFVNRTGQPEPGYYLAIAILCWVFAFIFLCAMVFLWRDVMIAVDIMEEATRVPIAMPSMVLVPPVCLILVVPYFIFAVITAIYIQTSGDTVSVNTPLPSNYFADGSLPAAVTNTTGESLNTSTLEFPNWRYPAHVYNIFFFLWSFGFFNAVGFLILSLCTVFWYWSKPGDDKEPPFFAPLVGAKITLRYHLGTLALGSFIVALIQTIRVVVAFIEQRLKQAGENSDATKCAFKCIHCFLAYFERVVKFINKNAYISCALKGDNFIAGARRGVALLLANAFSVAALNIVSEYVLIFGKILITCLTTLIGYFILNSLASADNPTNENAFTFQSTNSTEDGVSNFDKYTKNVSLGMVVMLVLIALMSYVVASLFVNVLGVAIDTLLFCFCYDKGEAGYDYYPTDLAKHVEGAYKGPQYAAGGGDNDENAQQQHGIPMLEVPHRRRTLE